MDFRGSKMEFRGPKLNKGSSETASEHKLRLRQFYVNKYYEEELLYPELHPTVNKAYETSVDTESLSDPDLTSWITSSFGTHSSSSCYERY